MRAFLTFLFFLYYASVSGQDLVTEEVLKLIKVCDVCTCSEIPVDIEGNSLVLNILCSELDKIENVADLDKIAWPLNPNGLKITASFERLGISTLGKLPPNSQVASLRFSNNAIKTYWPDPFSDVPNLKKLSFAQNELTEVTPDLFTKIQSLEDLDLSYNKLTDFNAIDFKFLPNVKRLNLQSNQLKKIPIEALHPMKVLEELDLSKNLIYDLLLRKDDSGSLKGLKILNLSGNKIRSVMMDSFPEDNNIELLDLSNNIIEIVEEDAFLSCNNLRELNLAQNNITFIFNLPATLQIAILKVNTLYHWPKFPNAIKYVDLSYNRLSTMYDEKSINFDNLEVLNIGGNQLKELNIDNKLPNLIIFDISYNLLTEVPKILNTQLFPKLEELHLDGNIIESIYFKNIIALKSLHMSELNKLRVVDDKAFSNVVGRDETENNCFSLYLSNCPLLSEIKDGAFDGTALCMLDISKNNLTSLSPRLTDWSSVSEGVDLQWNPWRCACDLQWVVDTLLPLMYSEHARMLTELSKNNLTSLSPRLTDWSSVSEGVDLQWNPWRCACDLQWVVDTLLPLMYSEHARMLTELRCGSPRAYEGLRLVHWYNWTEQAMCTDGYNTRATYMLEPSSEANNPKVSTLTLILGGLIIVSLLIAIALTVYLIKTRRKYRVRQAALKRKRQSAADAKNGNGLNKEQFSALNKV